MADDTSVQDDALVEPVPDNLADVELKGLEPVDDSDGSAEGDETEETTETSEETTEDTEDSEETEESKSEEDTEEEPSEEAEEQPEPLDPKEQARQAYELRQQQKANKDFVQAQREQIREYQTQADPEDLQAQLKAIQANQWVDTVERNRTQLVTELQAAQSNIPLLKSDPQLFAELVDEFENSYGVHDQDTGEILGAVDRQGNPVSVGQFLQREAARIERYQQTSQRTAQHAEAKMRSKAVAPTNQGKTTSSGDDLDDLLDRIGDVRLV